MSWKCKIGWHRWVEIDTTDEWNKFCKEQKYGGLRITLKRGSNILQDEYCPRCDKLSLNDLEENKKFALNYKQERYTLKNGKVVKQEKYLWE